MYNEFYAQHSIFEEAYKRGKFPYLNSAFTVGTSNRVLESDHIHLTKPEYVMKSAIDIINLGICSPFVAVLSLASVLCSPIKVLC